MQNSIPVLFGIGPDARATEGTNAMSRNMIESLVAAFLANGGRVTRCPEGNARNRIRIRGNRTR
jgi:hypothetical protein